MVRRVILNGTTDDKIITCLKAAGWYNGRCVDLTEVKAFYSSFGISIPEYAENFLKEYYGLLDNWYFNEAEDTLLKRAPDIEFYLYPTHDESVDEERFEQDFAEMFDSYLERIQLVSGESAFLVGNIGYYYPAMVFIAQSGKIYTAHNYDDLIHCYESVSEMLKYDFTHSDEWISVSMNSFLSKARYICYKT
ncbi:SUKH-3 domain-containing protein [uncultured Ruminococcus sp.]|uniref:SUKH-3 domain-containing protein n=1 Tax=uncultured Ruminococcus sp. TaxID=165186 RepID=UPI0025CB7F30|nr:SUKH-3 domain-containing protein [uncultured Ruminococcus sp.]